MAHRFLRLSVVSGKIPCGNHQDSFGFYINSDGDSRRYQCLVVDYLNVYRFKRNEAEQLQIHGIGLNILRIEGERLRQVHGEGFRLPGIDRSIHACNGDGSILCFSRSFVKFSGYRNVKVKILPDSRPDMNSAGYFFPYENHPAYK